eukprot:COSAG02_NODE_11875_length_1637_cov_1.170351_2_plen_81_part_01
MLVFEECSVVILFVKTRTLDYTQVPRAVAGAAFTKATTPASPGAAPSPNAKNDTNTHWCDSGAPGHGTSLNDGFPKAVEPP